MKSGLTSPLQPVRPEEFSLSAKSRFGIFALISVVALVVLGAGVFDAPFVDEYAYLSQSYYADLLIDGKTNDRAWLDFPAYDLVPLPKYLIDLALRTFDRPRPGPEAARAWYRDTSSRFGDPFDLRLARIPSVVLGVVGCLAVVVLGARTFGWRVGVAAAFLLMINPLYKLHAHRAMSEIPCEAFLLVAMAAALGSWRKAVDGKSTDRARLYLGLIIAGVATGFSVLAKFNGLLALMTLAVWVLLAWCLPGRPWPGKRHVAVGSCLAVVAAWLCFVVLNPYMTAHPATPLTTDMKRIDDLNAWERFRFLIDHRREMSRSQQLGFPHNALISISERAKVVAVQGFGRFGPLGAASSDSTRRYDLAQDWGAFVWLPLCLGGLVYAVVVGRRQYRAGDAPAAWALTAWALLSLVVVTLYLPMAWDRYQLPIQAPFALVASSVLVGGVDYVVSLFRSSKTGKSA